MLEILVRQLCASVYKLGLILFGFRGKDGQEAVLSFSDVRTRKGDGLKVRVIAL